MKILITGSNGFIGSNLIKKLCKTGHNIYGSVRKNSNINSISDQLNSFKLVEYDLNSNSFKKLLNRMDCIFHCVGNSYPMDKLDLFESAKLNILENIKFYEIIQNNKKKKLIFPSSGGAVYGNITGKYASENTNIDPISSYAIFKYCNEKIINLCKINNKFDYCILRVSNIYGPKPSTKPSFGLIPSCITKIESDDVIEVFGSLSLKRDYLYIDDFLTLVEQIINKDISGVYNVSLGKSYSIKEVINIIEIILKKQAKIKVQKMPDSIVLNSIIDSKKIQDLTNWAPKIYLEEGIRKIINYDFHKK